MVERDQNKTNFAFSLQKSTPPPDGRDNYQPWSSSKFILQHYETAWLASPHNPCSVLQFQRLVFLSKSLMSVACFTKACTLLCLKMLVGELSAGRITSSLIAISSSPICSPQCVCMEPNQRIPVGPTSNNRLARKQTCLHSIARRLLQTYG